MRRRLYTIDSVKLNPAAHKKVSIGSLRIPFNILPFCLNIPSESK